MRFGTTLIGQFSHVTNLKGVECLRSQVPDGNSVEMLEVNNPHAMHIDTAICPLRQCLIIYCPGRVSEATLRKHDVLRSWDPRPIPFTPKPRLMSRVIYMFRLAGHESLGAGWQKSDCGSKRYRVCRIDART